MSVLGSVTGLGAVADFKGLSTSVLYINSVAISVFIIVGSIRCLPDTTRKADTLSENDHLYELHRFGR
jgi:hypothetical protein